MFLFSTYKISFFITIFEERMMGFFDKTRVLVYVVEKMRNIEEGNPNAFF